MQILFKLFVMFSSLLLFIVSSGHPTWSRKSQIFVWLPLENFHRQKAICSWSITFSLLPSCDSLKWEFALWANFVLVWKFSKGLKPLLIKSTLQHLILIWKMVWIQQAFSLIVTWFPFVLFCIKFDPWHSFLVIKRVPPLLHFSPIESNQKMVGFNFSSTI